MPGGTGLCVALACHCRIGAIRRWGIPRAAAYSAPHLIMQHRHFVPCALRFILDASNRCS